MENEQKTETVVSQQETSGEAKKQSYFADIKSKLCGNKKITTSLAIAILVLAVGGSYLYKITKKDIGAEQAKQKMEQFIKENTQGEGIEVSEVTKEAGLYKLKISANGQEIFAYMTTDGSKLFPQAINLEEAKDAASTDKQQVAEKTEAENKQDVPTVDLFVMSYCPYGLQMEKGMLPVVEALKGKIKFNLKFVDYTLHGQKEVDENTRQYCIQKNQPEKLNAYLTCFWKKSSGEAAACMKAVGIDANKVATCAAETTKQFSLTEKNYSIDKDENNQFGVEGSPTLVINGTKVSSGRDSASIMKAVCSGFTNQPKECANNKLSATSPAAGFDDQNTGGAASAGAAAAGACH
jgi:glutaredoxin